MSEQTEIEDWTVSLFRDLVSYGFSGPRIVHQSWVTGIDWSYLGISIEIELDWREREVSCLIVRLENGNLPAGYYVSNGMPCRYHLLKIIRLRKWPADQDAMNAILSRRKPHTVPRDSEEMKRYLQAHKSIVISCVMNITSEANDIFD